MNQITITGNLTADPELRYTPSGQPVCGFSVATNKKWTDGNGQIQEKVVFFRVSVWRGQAEPCANYLHKGAKVLVTGEMEPVRVYQKQDGGWAGSLDITAASVEFLVTDKSRQQTGQQSAMDAVPAPPAPRGQGSASVPPPQPQQESIPF